MQKLMEGSRAVAETVLRCEPAVVSAYPITPQTHIVEDLAKFKADGKAKYEYVRAESEFAAASIVLGASATGVRTYTATSSQGLLLMAEVLFNIAGMRLPIVLTCANRAVSAPINIWNDQQDSVTVRDAGWIMLYGETNQEVVDMHIMAFKIAEELSLPVMVNMDGFLLTHTFEPVDLPSQSMIKKFLPAYKEKKGQFLDPKDPKTFGAFATPNDYFEIREELTNDLMKSAVTIKRIMKEFKKIFKRGNGELVEYYGPKNAEYIYIAMGSVIGTIKEFVDQHNKDNKKQIAVLKVKSLRPFPDSEIRKYLESKKYIAVIDKSISIGAEGILGTEIKRAMYESKKRPVIKNYIMGLGGRDIHQGMLGDIFNELSKKNSKTLVFKGK
jgi:pyruvate ferredoxin oxidoreductase alpha subunit